MMLPAEWSRMERALLITALVFIIILAVKMTAFIVNLLLISVILTLLALPAIEWLKKKGLPHPAAVLIITGTACLVILMFILLSAVSFQILLSDIPLYQKELNLRLGEIRSLLGNLGISNKMLATPSINLESILSMGFSSLMNIGEGLMYLFFIGVTTLFMLLEAPHIGARMELLLGKNSDIMEQASRMKGYIIDFIIVRTETNFVHGVLFGGFLWVMGVHAAVLWGILTFLLGYIPYFGLIIAAVPAIFFAWLQFGIPGAVAVIAAVCLLNIVIENPVYSYLAAQKFEMPALIVILSVILWGWLLGLAGMLFAVPITLLLTLAFQLSDETRWINRVLGVSHLFEETGTGKKVPDPDAQER